MTVDMIVAETLALSSHARAFVAEKLIESLDVDTGAALSPARQEEIRRRCRELDEGCVELRDADVIFAKAYAALA